MLIDCSLVIFDPGAVCRTHFAQTGAATRHDFGNSKGIPDLDLFSPGNDNFSAFTQGVQHKKDCSGIVVHHDRRFALEQLDERSADVDITLSACPVPDRIQDSNSPSTLPANVQWHARAAAHGQDWCAPLP